jgi:hypothetical protein
MYDPIPAIAPSVSVAKASARSSVVTAFIAVMQ